ncbi:MAG: EFR1 family ferrodoxin [Methanomicrobiales archaeon]
MKTVIYYFSGTGNSLSVAKKIAAALGNCDVVPIASLKDTPEIITPAAERVGIVCPVYFSGLPLMVAGFAGRVNYSHCRYTFAVVTFGGSGSAPALRQLDRLIVNGYGRGLDAGFSVKMPGNYILMYSSPAGKKQADLLAAANLQIEKIIPIIEHCEHRDIPLAIFSKLFHFVAYPWFTSHAPNKAQQFTVTSACTSCGTCVKVCPAGNIDLRQGKPVWKDRCEVCCGCIHLCPEGAIQAGPRTAKRERYRNPSVSIVELEVQHEKKP